MSRNHLLCIGLQAILSDLTTTGMVTEQGNEYDLLHQEQPRLIIVDMESHQNVTQLIGQIKQAVPATQILMLAGLNDMEGVREASSVGIDGIFLTVQPPVVLLAIVTALLHSPPSADAVAANGCSAPRPHLAGLASLTQRERDIVRLVGQGLANKEIADQTCISIITVRHHLTSIFEKLGVATRQKLLIHAHQVGMIQPIVESTL